MSRHRQALSKNLLQMKFMQRSKEKVEHDRQDEASKDLLGAGDLTETMRKEGDKYYLCYSFAHCERLRHGRMSFKGMNPEVEKLMAERDAQDQQKGTKRKAEDPEEIDVSQQEMATRYTKYISNRFNAQKSRRTNKFIRPVDDEEDEDDRQRKK